ncbi:CBS domain containing-hemolysin-like protein [Bacillus sp. SORGH_AS 510]|uniref:hemolysin family protein n=1 Tax=Bacillus sp. SORGH_AS_0510 TaxID=3041771 RepID=UPI00278725E8|nr:hemolysin family protein [Bacillus sp. SORGH_AS_0510]MDQ1145932.1 CBS domain containing-hemolysin-like protein [Bacillus sp. SORGH_AS_0510]
MIIGNLIIIAILIAFTAFFVSYEFAIVKIRGSRIDQLVAEGNKNAIAAKTIVSNLDEYLSACQLGITVTALGLGWLGEPTVEHILHPLFVHLNLPESVSGVMSFVLAFASVTFIHVVVGELAPKTIAIQKAEAVTLTFAKPMILFYKIMYPFIKALNGSARMVTGIFGLKPASEHEIAHSEEELQLIISESYKSGEINQSEYKYVNNIFEFDDRHANEIMVPRTEIVAFDISQSLDECLQIVTEENYTRYPVIDGEKDNIIGMVNMKEVFTEYIKGKNVETSIAEYVRPVIQVIESIPIHDLLVKMQKERVHMAILMDEYGGTAGLVTVEDILEEIVGEIRDEFDADEVPDINKISETKTIVDGKVLIDEINDLFGLDIENTDMDTIGGWIMSEKIDVIEGDTVQYNNYEFKVIEIDGYHIKSLQILKINQESYA